MSLFAKLRKIREFERQQIPFLRSMLDFDIIIEIGYAQELKRPLTPKTLFLLNLGSTSTVRRRLAQLTQQGIVKRRTDASDRRSDFLTLSQGSLKVFGKYGSVLSDTWLPS